jgi:hypothetical protein
VFEFMGWSGCRNKPYGIQTKGMLDVVGHSQVPVMDRIKGAAQQADLLLFFFCMLHNRAKELNNTEMGYVRTWPSP